MLPRLLSLETAYRIDRKHASALSRSGIARRVKSRAAPRAVATMLHRLSSHTAAKSQGVRQDCFVCRARGPQPRPTRRISRCLVSGALPRRRKFAVATPVTPCRRPCPSRSRRASGCRPQYRVSFLDVSTFVRTANGHAMHPVARTRRCARSGRALDSNRWRLVAIRAAAHEHLRSATPRKTHRNGVGS